MTVAQRALGGDTRSLVLLRLLLGAALLQHVATATWPGGLRAGAAMAAFALCIGWRTTLAAVLGYLCLVAGYVLSDYARADGLLLVLLLLAPFLPLAEHFSVDAALATVNAPSSAAAAAPSPRTLVSIATLALTLQVVIVLFSSAESAVLGDGSPRSAGALNLLAIASPLLVVLPLPGGVLRTLALLALCGGVLFAAPDLAGDVSKLSLCAALAALLPAAPWQWLSRAPRLRVPEGLHIYFDRDCGFCRKTCYLFRSFMLLGTTAITPVQDDAHMFEIMQRENTWVVTDSDGSRHRRWHAVLYLLRRSPLWWPLGYALTWLGMGYWGDPLYALTAASRGGLSKITAVILPYRDERPVGGPLANVIVGAWLALMLFFAFAPISPTQSGNAVLASGARALGLAQYWNLW